MSHSDTSKRCLNCAWITVALREGCGELEVQTTLIPVTTEGQLFQYSQAHCGSEYYSMISVCYATIFRHKCKGLSQKAKVAQGVPGRLRPRIFLMFGTTRVLGRQP
jgi:hypothetical protein